MNFKMILKKNLMFPAAAAGLMMYSFGLSAGNDQPQAAEDLYIAEVSTYFNPTDKITFAGCDTPENYARYAKALHDNASDDVLTELRSEGNCIILSNRDFIFYHIKIKSMDEKTGRVTEVVRDFGGITDGPYFTDIVPDKKLIRNTPYDEQGEKKYQEKQDRFSKKWAGKVFVTEYNPCVFGSLPEYRQYLYESRKAKDPLMMIEFKSAGKCLVLKNGTLVQVVSTEIDETTEYKVLSGEYKGRTVYRDRRIVKGTPMVFSE